MMAGLPLHLAGLALLALWVRVRPRPRLGVLFLLWWLGVLLLRLVPGYMAARLAGHDEMSAHREVAILVALTSWVGSLLMLRALIGLALWDRPRVRWVRIATGLMALALLLAGFFAERNNLFPFLAMPFFWSFRWRKALSAKWLALVTLTGLLSIGLSSISFGRNPAEWFRLLPGSGSLPSLVTVLALIYSLLAIPVAASRIHLSIRRISHRLIGSHLLAGLIPFGLAALFLLLSGALFLATYRGTIGARTLAQESERARRRIERSLDAAGTVPADPFGEDTPGQIVLESRDAGPTQVLRGATVFPPDSLLAQVDSSAAVPLLWDGRALYLRARVDHSAGGHRFRVEALSPVDSLRMETISRVLGMPVRVSPHTAVANRQGGIQIGAAEDERDSSGVETRGARRSGSAGSTEDERGSTAAGSGPAADPSAGRGSIGPAGMRGHGLPGGTVVQCLRWSRGRWSRSAIPVSSYAGIGEQIVSLFRLTRENLLALIVLIALGLLAALFLGALWVASSMVVDMGRSITRAVRSLTTATAALREGKLDHRIKVEGQDELWSVAASFNEMAEGLQRMRSMEMETQRLEEELRLARVIQDRLLPAAPPSLEKAELAGVSLPAREVGGDYFDYIVLDGGLVGVAVADVSGKGAPAALLMSTFRASLRSQDLARLGPAAVLGRINRFIHSSVDPGRFITAFLGLLDPATGTFRYANAGHDAPMLVAPDGSCGELGGGGLILGLLPQIVYEEASTVLGPGTLVAVYTDGVTEARDPAGEFYGSERLADTLRVRRGESCADLLRHAVESIQGFSGSGPQSDDITLVLVRQR